MVSSQVFKVFVSEFTVVLSPISDLASSSSVPRIGVAKHMARDGWISLVKEATCWVLLILPPRLSLGASRTSFDRKISSRAFSGRFLLVRLYRGGLAASFACARACAVCTSCGDEPFPLEDAFICLCGSFLKSSSHCSSCKLPNRFVRRLVSFCCCCCCSSILWDEARPDVAGPPCGSPGLCPKHRHTESNKCWICELFILGGKTFCSWTE